MFAIRLPLTYFIYRDNQEAYRQTVIGLSLDKRTFQPLAPIIAKEVGEDDQTALLRGYKRSKDRELLVKISAGLVSPARFPRPKYDGRSSIGQYGPFTIFKSHTPPQRSTGCSNEVGCKFGDMARGVTMKGPVMHLLCPSEGLCIVSFPLRGAEVDMYVSPRELGRAGELREGVVALLERHLVSK